MIWVDAELQPKPPSARDILEAAAARLARRLSRQHGLDASHLRGPPPRAGERQSARDREQLRLNLERARALPSAMAAMCCQRDRPAADHVRWRKAVDSMKVVVGKPKNPTPMMAALIRLSRP
jgi:murein L,D-transpeptidase YcbB/YkuD